MPSIKKVDWTELESVEWDGTVICRGDLIFYTDINDDPDWGIVTRVSADSVCIFWASEGRSLRAHSDNAARWLRKTLARLSP